MIRFIRLAPVIFLFCQLHAVAQVSVHDGGGTDPNTSSMLDVQSSAKGVLIPRVALTGPTDATTIASPATSLLIYNTATVGGLTPGYYYNSGTSGSPSWTRLMSGNTVPLAGSGSAYQVAYWSGANALTGTGNFTYGSTGNLSVFNAESVAGEVRLGAAWGRPGVYSTTSLNLFTAPSQPIIFGNNNAEYMRLTSAGNLGIGANPVEALEIYRNGSNPVQLFHSGGVASYKVGNDGSVFKIAAMDNGYGGSGGNFAANDLQVLSMTTTGNVGIGNVAPNVKLNVGEAIPAGHQYVYLRAYGNEPGSWKGSAAFGYSSASVIMGQLNNVATIGSHTGNLNAWADLAINPVTAGNVGIGLSNPGAKLTVRRDGTDPSTYDDGKTLFVSGSYGSGQAYDGGVEFRHDNLSQGIGIGYNTIYQTGTNANEMLNLIGRGTGAITLNAYGGATGNVGIGITGPQSKLHVMGKLNVHQSGGGGGQNRFEGMEAPTSANGRGQLVISSAYSDLIVASSQANDNHGSTISLATYDPGNASSYRKWVINQGNWGARSQFLDFGYAVNIPNPHSAINSGNTTMTLDGVNRRVGIGNISPSSRLEVLHNTTMANTLYDASNIEVATDNASNPSIGFHRQGYSATALYHAGYGNNSLRIRNADGFDAALLHEGNLTSYGILNQYGGAQSANFWISGTGRADAVMRAPWFTVSDFSGGVPGGDGSFYRTSGQPEISMDDWMYLRDISDNNIRVQFYMDNGGQVIFGPNTGWSAYLRVGGNANQTDWANIATTNGNLHIDNRAGHALYLNHYVNNWIRHGNGGTGYILNGSFEYFDDDSWIYNRYAPNNRVYFENRLGVRGNIGIGGNPWGWTDARCSDCADAITGNPNLWLTAQDRVYFAARNTGEAYEFSMETPGSGNYDKGVVPQFANYGRLGTPGRYWWITYSGHFRYKHFWDDYEGFDTYDDIAELRAIEMDTVWDPILNHHVGKVRGETIPKFLTNYEDEENAGEFIDVRRMDGFLLGVSRQIDRETVERDERLTARTEVLAKALGVDFSVPDDDKLRVRIQDFGAATGSYGAIEVKYSDEFSEQITDGDMVNVSVTPAAPYASFYVERKDRDGFTVQVSRAGDQQNFSFDWTATAFVHTRAGINGKPVSSTDDVFYRKPIVVTGKDHPVSNHGKKRDLTDEERGLRVAERERLRAERISQEHIDEMNRNANVPEHSTVPETPSGPENNMPADPAGRSTPPDKALKPDDAPLPDRKQNPGRD